MQIKKADFDKINTAEYIEQQYIKYLEKKFSIKIQKRPVLRLVKS